MEEPEKGLSTFGTLESTVTHDVKVADETLEGSLDCGGQVQVEGGACNGKDVMVEVLGSDVYIDGVCTRGSGDSGEGLDGDVKSAGVGGGAEARFEDSGAVEFDEARRGNAAVELDGGVVLGGEGRDQAVLGNDECDVASLRGDNRAQKEVGTGVSGSCSVVNTTSSNHLNDCGAPEDGNDVTLGTLDEQKTIANLLGDKIMEKEARIYHDVEIDDKLNSVGEQQMGNNKVDDNSNNTLEEAVGGTEVAIDKALLNSEEKQGFSLQKCTEKEQMTDTSEIKAADTSVSFGSEKNLDANAISMIVDKDTQVADPGNLALKGAVEEKIHDESKIRQNVEVQVGISDQVGLNGGQENDEFNEAEQRKTTDRKVIKRAPIKPGNSEKEGEFSVSDMVWGKVRSHPWWPGQIFDPSDSSEKAMKHYKKDCHLVAYFGDRTFAWNEASQLKPFVTHFSSIEKQSTSESFHNAVDNALDEVARRVEYGLACSCIPEDTYNTIKLQTVENTGIRRELCSRQVVDESRNASSFSPNKLIEYMKTLSELPTGGFDRLELVVAKAQLLAFYRFKGYTCLPELQYYEDTLVDEDEENLSEVMEHTTPVIKNDGKAGLGNLKNQSSSRRKRKHNLKDTMHLSKKERTMSELMGGTPDSPDGDYLSDVKATDNLVSRGRPKKRKTIDLHADDSGSPDSPDGDYSSDVKVTDKLVSRGRPKKRKTINLHADDSGMQDSPDGVYLSDVKVTDNLVSRGRPKKKKTIDLHADDSEMQDRGKTISLAKVSNTPKQSFKIGDCIRRVASQLTGSPSMLKSGDRSQKTDGTTDGFPGNEFDVSFPDFEDAQRSDVIVPTEYSSLDDLLSSLQWVAQEPFGEYSFLNDIVSFFSDFRNSVVVADDFGKEKLHTDKVGSKRKKPPIAESSETFEFEDMSDTYWTDRVVDNGNEEQQAQPAEPAREQPVQPTRRNRKKDYQPVPAESEKPVKVSRRPYSRKQYSESNHAEAPEKPAGYIDENAPAELVMNFAELDSVPSETNLNKMFRRFGPLKESETEVDRVSSRARVVFKKCVDAEVALNSAEKFSIFGSVLVNYQLNYTPSALFKASSVGTTQDQEMHLDLSNFEVNMF